MATDGPTPPPCDNNIYRNGSTVFITDSVSSNRMERWVKAVAAECGQPVDWHFIGGRAQVLATGDLAKVNAAITKLMPLHDQLRRESLAR